MLMKFGDGLGELIDPVGYIVCSLEGGENAVHLTDITRLSIDVCIVLL